MFLRTSCLLIRALRIAVYIQCDYYDVPNDSTGWIQSINATRGLDRKFLHNSISAAENMRAFGTWWVQCTYLKMYVHMGYKPVVLMPCSVKSNRVLGESIISNLYKGCTNTSELNRMQIILLLELNRYIYLDRIYARCTTIIIRTV